MFVSIYADEFYKLSFFYFLTKKVVQRALNQWLYEIKFFVGPLFLILLQLPKSISDKNSSIK